MIVVIGDTHADINKLLSALKGLCEKDYLIVAGDFGFVFRNDRKEELVLDTLEKTKAEILFVDGNHENFDALNSYPAVIWNGGKTHQIRHNIHHLMRGQVFSIAGKKIFTFGGAFSNDKNLRIKGRTWWSEELPNDSEYEEAIANLTKHDMVVDYIITHQLPGQLQIECGNNKEYCDTTRGDNRLLVFFDQLLYQVHYKQWLCGHLHIDKSLPRKVRVLFMGKEIISNE